MRLGLSVSKGELMGFYGLSRKQLKAALPPALLAEVGWFKKRKFTPAETKKLRAALDGRDDGPMADFIRQRGLWAEYGEWTAKQA